MLRRRHDVSHKLDHEIVNVKTNIDDFQNYVIVIKKSSWCMLVVNILKSYATGIQVRGLTNFLRG